MKRLLVLATFLLALLPTPGWAQSNATMWCWNGAVSQPCNTGNPLATAPVQQTATTTEAKVTVAVTNTYQQALAASATRKGCTIQYIAVGGTKGFVFFGSAPADTTTSFQLANGQTASCNAPGVTLTDAVQVTGTGTDIFVVTNQ